MHTNSIPFTPSDRLLTPYFEALDRHVLTTTRCTSCLTAQFPPRTACSACGTFDAFEWIEVSGKGEIWTFGIFHKMYFPNFGPAPYNVAVVQLDEGTKLVTNINDADDLELSIGLRVHAVFVDIDGHTAVRFAPDTIATVANEESR